jgi:death on curing protein
VDEPRFLTLAEVLHLHDQSLARFGGLAGIGDRGLVESALASAKNTFCYGGGGSLFEIAAAYAFRIAEVQAFLDGNKRTAAAAAIAFLRLTGCRFHRMTARFTTQ